MNLPKPNRDRWTVLRAGILNIWNYDDQVFRFHNGRLLLRGENGAGKSKALELLFPLILDGNYSPGRLDPFGTGNKTMWWNVLGYRPEGDRDTTVGYIWFEFGKEGSKGPEYFTCGAAFKARPADTDIQPWYFTTSLRIGENLSLIKDRVPLSEKSLKECLGNHGTCWGKRQDYRREVNARLIGLQEEQYEVLIRALLNLRKPKLSEHLDPKQLSEFLTESLPPMNQLRVEELAQSFRRLEQHAQDCKDLQRNLKLIGELEVIYRDYSRSVVRQKAQTFLSAESAYQTSLGEQRKALELYEQAKTKQEELRAIVAELEKKKNTLEGKIEALRSSDEFKAAQQIIEGREQLKERANNLEKRRKAVTGIKERVDRQKTKVDDEHQELARKREDLKKRLETAGKDAENAALEKEHQIVEGALSAGHQDVAKTHLEELLRHRAEAISQLEKISQELSGERSKLAIIEQKLAAQALHLSRLRDDLHQAQREEEAEKLTYLAKVEDWLETAKILGDPGVGVALKNEEFERIPEIVREAAAAKRNSLYEKRSAADKVTAKIQEEVDKIEGERQALLSQPHRLPLPPAWRNERPVVRPGAPLYMLCEFLDLPAKDQAGIEAALEASGMLDAWVTPDGSVLDPKTFDVLFTPGPGKGKTLTDYLEGSSHNGVTKKVAESVLRTIPVITGKQSPSDLPVWISVDGRWRNGPLSGVYEKKAAEFIGENARERSRAARLKELEEARQETLRTLEGAKKERTSISADLNSLDEEVRLLPTLTALERARITREQAETNTGRAIKHVEEFEAQSTEQSKKVEEIKRRREVLGANFGLSKWMDQLHDVRSLTLVYESAAREALSVAADETRMKKNLETWENELAIAILDQKKANEDVEQEESEFSRFEAYLKQLEAKSGKSLKAVTELDKNLRADLAKTANEIREKNTEKEEAANHVGSTANEVGRHKESVAKNEGELREAEGAFKKMDERKLFASAHTEVKGEASSWSRPDSLVEARKIVTELRDVEYNQRSIENLLNRQTRKAEELTLALPAHMKVYGEYKDSIWMYFCQVSNQKHTLQRAMSVIGLELEERQKNLSEEDSKLFDKFLSSETKDHLRDRLRESAGLVKEMNEQIARRPTNFGLIIKLQWEIQPEAPPGTAQAITALLKSSEIVNGNDRKILKDFLSAQLQRVRDIQDERSITARMADVLDYRKWYHFVMKYQEDGSDWKVMTKKEHSKRSGGEKAMLVCLPLFAAAMAFYKSARPDAPRLIAMDEAFAGIDPGQRGPMMGLAFELGLDLFMTSYDEWGTYPQVDGLSIYELSRKQGFPGVCAEQFIWDGEEKVLIKD